tara:strand:- start:30252 stop:30881 length:630 start_codon:yes stop_codon:yes gene_type:complete
MDEQLKTGTTTVGIVCKDAVILAADKRATAGNMIVDKKAEKVHIISDDYAVTIAGSVSEAQLIIKLIRAELKLKEIRTNKRVTAKEAANLLGGMCYGNLRKPSMFPGVAHFLMGGRDDSGLHLYDLFPDGSVTHVEKFISSGSGSVFAYGVLETQWKEDLSVEEGIKLVTTAINTALQRDSCSGNGINIVVVNKDEIKWAMNKDLVATL